MSILWVFVLVKGAKFSVKSVHHHYANGCFSPQQALRKVNKGYKNWEQHCLDSLNMLFVEGPVSNEKLNWRPHVACLDKGFSLYTFSLIITTGYRKHYYFFLFPRSHYQRKQIIELQLYRKKNE